MSNDGHFTRSLLADYRHQMRALKAQELLLKEMEAAAEALPSPLPTGAPGGSGDGRQLERSVIHLDRERELLQQRRVAAAWRRGVVMSYIEQVPDTVIKAAIYQRYIAGRSWKQIAVRHGAGASESALRMLVVRYTDKHPITWILRG